MTDVKANLDRVALITGAGKRRVGNAIAWALADRGYRVAIHFHRSAEAAEQTLGELRSRGAVAEAFQADLRSPEETSRMVGEVHRRFGRLDVLVTAAAIWEATALEATSADDLRRHFEVNTLSTFVCCQQAGLIMAAQPEGGAIITLGDWAIARPYPNYAAYFASKGAIPTLTRTLAVELARRNPRVRVNCILPGPVMLPENLSPEERHEAIAGTLLRREGTPEHVAHAVVFLVENDFVTGVCLPVDGGRSIA